MAIPKMISPKTQLLDAITRGDSYGLSDLLLSPSFPNINRFLDGNGFSPAMLAVRSNSPQCLSLLIEKSNPDLEAKDNGGYTALMEAARLGHCDAIHILVQTKKVNIDAKSRSGKTAYNIAVDNRNFKCAEMLMAARQIGREEALLETYAYFVHCAYSVINGEEGSCLHISAALDDPTNILSVVFNILTGEV